MPDSKNRDDRRLYALLSAIADNMDEQDATSLAEEAGGDVNAVADETRALLLSSLMAAKKRRLERAQVKYAGALKNLDAGKKRLPATSAQRRTLLEAILTNAPRVREGLVTLQHRNLESFSNADVDSALEQLAVLGLLDDRSDDDK